MKTLIFLVLSSLLLTTTVWAQPTPVLCDNTLVWSYESSPKLGWFYVYVSAQSGTHPTVPTKPVKSRPTKIVPVKDLVVSASASGKPMTGQVACADIPWRGSGPWYVVVTSVALDMSEETGWDNELMIVGNTLPVSKPPVVPVVPGSKPVVVLPPPLAHAVRPQTPEPSMTLGSRGHGGGLPDTDVWRGIGATPPPPLRRDIPGAP